MALDIVAVVSIAISGAVMLLQTLFTSRCTHIECCSENGCLSCDRKLSKKNENNQDTRITGRTAI